MAILYFDRVLNDVDLSASAGALQTITDLDFPVFAGETIFFEYTIHWDAGVNIGARFGINGPAGTLRVGTIQSNSTATADHSSISALNTVIFAATAGVNTPDSFAVISGVFLATASGTLSFQACNEGSGAITLYANSAGKFESDTRLELVLTDTLNALTDVVVLRGTAALTLNDNLSNWADSCVLQSVNFKPLTDTLAPLTDALAFSLGISLTLSDTTPAFSDAVTLSRKLRWRDAYTQSLVVADPTLNLADSINNLADAYKQIGNGFANYSDTINFWIDSLTGSKQARWQDSHVLNLVSQDFYLVLTDTLTTQLDSLQIGYGLLVTDTNTLSDSTQLIENQLLSFSDSFTLTDSVQIVIGQPLSFVDNIDNLTDSYSHIFGQLLSFNDTLGLSDLLTIGYGLLISESINFLADNCALRLSYQLQVADSAAAWLDALQLGYGLLTNDLLVITDSETQVIGYQLSRSDSFTLTDSAARAVIGVLNLSDTIIIVDSLRIGYGLLISEDLNSWQDSITTSAPQPPNLTYAFSDTVNNWQDSLAATLVHQFNFSEIYVQNDSLALGYGALFSDSVNNLTDSNNNELGQFIAFSDSFALTDSVTVRLDQQLSFSDSIDNLTDSFQIILGLNLVFVGDIAFLQDLVVISQLGSIQVSDTLIFSDAIELKLDHFIHFTDFFTLTDSYSQFRGTTDGLELSDNLDNWQDHFFRRYRGVSADRTVFVQSTERTVNPNIENRTIIMDNETRIAVLSGEVRLSTVPDNPRSQTILNDQRDD